MRCRRQQDPFSLLQRSSHVLGFCPSAAVVTRSDHQELSGFPNLKSGRRPSFVPLVFPRVAPHPNPGTKNLSGLLVHNDARIAAPVLLLWKTSVFPHVHDHPNGLPGLTAVGTAIQSDVDVFLEVTTLSPPHVIHAQQGALRSRGQGGNPRGVHAILIMLAQGKSYPLADSGCRVSRDDLSGGRHDLRTLCVQLVVHVGSGPECAGEPEDVSAFPQHLSTIVGQRT